MWTAKRAGLLYVGGGLAIGTASLLADQAGLGRAPGFGPIQTLFVVVAALVVCSGLWLRRAG
jgi:hypothetical protein